MKPLINKLIKDLQQNDVDHQSDTLVKIAFIFEMNNFCMSTEERLITYGHWLTRDQLSINLIDDEQEEIVENLCFLLTESEILNQVRSTTFWAIGKAKGWLSFCYLINAIKKFHAILAEDEFISAFDSVGRLLYDIEDKKLDNSARQLLKDKDIVSLLRNGICSNNVDVHEMAKWYYEYIQDDYSNPN